MRELATDESAGAGRSAGAQSQKGAVLRVQRRADVPVADDGGRLDPVPRQLKFELRARKGKTMDPARMQMDWMRYWSMRAPNEKSIKAPQLELSTFNGAC